MAVQNRVSKSGGITGERAWKEFLGDRARLEAHRVTSEEIEFLRTVRLFGRTKTVDEILFILKNVREVSARASKAKNN